MSGAQPSGWPCGPCGPCPARGRLAASGSGAVAVSGCTTDHGPWDVRQLKPTGSGTWIPWSKATRGGGSGGQPTPLTTHASCCQSTSCLSRDEVRCQASGQLIQHLLPQLFFSELCCLACCGAERKDQSSSGALQMASVLLCMSRPRLTTWKIQFATSLSLTLCVHILLKSFVSDTLSAPLLTGCHRPMGHSRF